jgi:hypothetical protein
MEIFVQKITLMQQDVYVQYCNGFDQRVASQQFCKHGPTDSLDGGSARRKAATYTGQHKHRINADRQPYPE